MPYICGPVNQAFQISNRLESLNIASPILTTYCDVRSELPNKEKIEAVDLIRCKNQFRLMRYCVSLGMARHLKKFDILHSHNYRNFQSDLGFLFSVFKRKPFVLNTHGSLLGYKKYLPSGIPQWPYKIYDRLTFKTVARRADAIVVSSEFERNDAIEFGIDLKKVHVIPMGIDLPIIFSENRIEAEPLRLLFVGRLARVRRVELLIKAISLMNFPVMATIVGGEEKTATFTKSGYLDELKKLAEELMVAEKIEFVGPKKKGELSKYYSNSDVFIYPSLYENFGQPILEAAAAGLPIVSTNVGVARQIVIESETGFIVSNKPNEISARVSDLVNLDTRMKMSKKIRKKVEKDFGWEMIIKKYLKLYNSF